MDRLDVLLIGENSVHPFDERAPLIERAFGDGVDVTVSTDVADLADLAEYDVVADYLTDSTLTDAQAESLRSFVREGGGYLPVHCAADLTNYVGPDGDLEKRDQPVPVLRELIGGHFVGHPDKSTFGVDVVDGVHPVTDGVDDFEVFDEPYKVAYDADRIRVLARMDHPDLEAYPVVWVREPGDGRLCYSSLGHTDEALEHEAHRRILYDAVRWVAGR